MEWPVQVVLFLAHSASAATSTVLTSTRRMGVTDSQKMRDEMHLTRRFWVSIGGILKRAFEPLELEKTTH